MRKIRLHCLTALCVVIVQIAALPQRAAGAPAPQEGWDVAVYPILAWVPLGIGIDVDIPPFEGDVGGAGDIVDSRFDGAFLGGGPRPTVPGGSRATPSGPASEETASSDLTSQWTWISSTDMPPSDAGSLPTCI